MSMMLERFTENDKKVMVLKPSGSMPLQTAFHQSVFFSKKHACDEYRLELPRKTLVFEQSATEELLQKNYKQLTPEEYRKLEHDVSPFSKEGWTSEDKQELHAFLFDLALLIQNIPWAHELYEETH